MNKDILRTFSALLPELRGLAFPADSRFPQLQPECPYVVDVGSKPSLLEWGSCYLLLLGLEGVPDCNTLVLGQSSTT